MSKQVTQETFNSVVLENINEFEMSPEEALEDAIKQFEVQGVNLQMIVKDAKMFTNGGINEEASAKNELQTSLRSLLEVLDSEDSSLNNKEYHDSFLNACENIQRICEKGIAERCLATSVGAYEILIKCIQKVIGKSDTNVDQSNELKLEDHHLLMLSILLKTFACYVESQPDMMEDTGMKLFLLLLDYFMKSPGHAILTTDHRIIVELLLDIFTKFCYMHENNRHKLIKEGLAAKVLKLTDENMSCDNVSELVIKACSLVQSFVLDDDIRVPFGHSHEHALIIVNKCGALPVLFNLLKTVRDSPGNEEASCAVITTIGHLIVRDEFCVKVSEMGGVNVVMEMLKQLLLSSTKKSSIIRRTLQLLKNLSGCDKVKVEVMSYPGGPETLCEALESHMSDASICEATCSLVASLVLRHPSHGKTFVEDNSIHDLLRRLMGIHEKNSQIQKSCSMVVRNIVSRNPDLRFAFLDAGLEELLRKALKKHHECCRDEITYALRDLDCNVELRELWSGSGKTLEQ